MALDEIVPDHPVSTTTLYVPLAAEVIDKGGHALSHRGELYSRDNVRARLNMRDFLDTLRGSENMLG